MWINAPPRQLIYTATARVHADYQSVAFPNASAQLLIRSGRNAQRHGYDEEWHEEGVRDHAASSAGRAAFGPSAHAQPLSWMPMIERAVLARL